MELEILNANPKMALKGCSTRSRFGLALAERYTDGNSKPARNTYDQKVIVEHTVNHKTMEIRDSRLLMPLPGKTNTNVHCWNTESTTLIANAYSARIYDAILILLFTNSLFGVRTKWFLKKPA
jgi:hypothetical protein